MILANREPHYSMQDVQPLLDALWQVAHIERLHGEIPRDQAAQKLAREALSRWNTVREKAYLAQQAEVIKP
jgi:hypothetical protein